MPAMQIRASATNPADHSSVASPLLLGAVVYLVLACDSARDTSQSRRLFFSLPPSLHNLCALLNVKLTLAER